MYDSNSSAFSDNVAALTQVAYKRAFPSARDATFAGGHTTYNQATPEMVRRANRVTSLVLLNKHYPEGKVNNIPKGYPSGRSIAVKKEWCQKQALKMEVERQIKARQEAHGELASTDTVLREAADVANEDMDVLPDPENL